MGWFELLKKLLFLPPAISHLSLSVSGRLKVDMGTQVSLRPGVRCSCSSEIEGMVLSAPGDGSVPGTPGCRLAGHVLSYQPQPHAQGLPIGPWRATLRGRVSFLEPTTQHGTCSSEMDGLDGDSDEHSTGTQAIWATLPEFQLRTTELK